MRLKWIKGFITGLLSMGYVATLLMCGLYVWMLREISRAGRKGSTYYSSYYGRGERR